MTLQYDKLLLSNIAFSCNQRHYTEDKSPREMQPDTNGGTTDPGGFVTLTPEGNFSMQWAFVDGGKNVAFKLRLQEHSWMAIGIHREGGYGMPHADMVGLGRKCSKCPSAHFKPSFLELNSIM